jgi:outer membrane protein assembly factor BamB
VSGSSWACLRCAATGVGRGVRFCGACGAALVTAPTVGGHSPTRSRPRRTGRSPRSVVMGAGLLASALLAVWAAGQPSPTAYDPSERTVSLPGRFELQVDDGSEVARPGALAAHPAAAGEVRRLAPIDEAPTCRPVGCPRWSLGLDGHQPVVSLGDVLVHVGSASLTGIDADTGAVLWSLPTRDPRAGMPPGTGLVPVDERRFLVRTGSALVLREVGTGLAIWGTTIADRTVDTAVLGDGWLLLGGRVRGGDRPAQFLSAVDLHEGRVRWTQEVHRHRLGTAGHVDAAVLAVESSPGRVRGVRIDDGETVWERTLELDPAEHWLVGRPDVGTAVEVVDPATGLTLLTADHPGQRVLTVGQLFAVVGPDRTVLLDVTGTERGSWPGPPLGWTDAGGETTIAWPEDGWVVLVSYAADGTPTWRRALPAPAAIWGDQVELARVATARTVRALSEDGRTTVAVRTDGPTEPPPLLSVAGPQTRLHLLGRTVLAVEPAGLRLQGPGGHVRVEAADRLVSEQHLVVAGPGGLLAIDRTRLEP